MRAGRPADVVVVVVVVAVLGCMGDEAAGPPAPVPEEAGEVAIGDDIKLIDREPKGNPKKRPKREPGTPRREGPSQPSVPPPAERAKANPAPPSTEAAPASTEPGSPSPVADGVAPEPVREVAPTTPARHAAEPTGVSATIAALVAWALEALMGVQPPPDTSVAGEAEAEAAVADAVEPSTAEAPPDGSIDEPAAPPSIDEAAPADRTAAAEPAATPSPAAPPGRRAGQDGVALPMAASPASPAADPDLADASADAGLPAPTPAPSASAEPAAVDGSIGDEPETSWLASQLGAIVAFGVSMVSTAPPPAPPPPPPPPQVAIPLVVAEAPTAPVVAEAPTAPVVPAVASSVPRPSAAAPTRPPATADRGSSSASTTADPAPSTPEPVAVSDAAPPPPSPGAPPAPEPARRRANAPDPEPVGTLAGLVRSGLSSMSGVGMTLGPQAGAPVAAGCVGEDCEAEGAEWRDVPGGGPSLSEDEDEALVVREVDVNAAFGKAPTSSAPSPKASTVLVEISSTPTGAEITVDGARVGVTPCIAELTLEPHEVGVSNASARGTHQIRPEAEFEGWCFLASGSGFDRAPCR